MVNVRVRNENNVNLAKSRVRSSSYGVSRIVQKSHSCRIFKKNRAILCAKLAGTLSDRRDLNVLAERDGRSADQCHHDVENLPSLFHGRSSTNPLVSSKHNVRLFEFENYGWDLDRNQVETYNVEIMTITHNEKAERFRALHEGPGAFVIPNPWDVASARLLAGLGFQALATSSAAAACVIGKRDGGLTRDEALAHARLIVNATNLPVSADLEKGFGDAPEVVAETIRLAAQVGLVGCTIEDATGNAHSPLYDDGLAVERIAAAAEAARALPFPFTLTARAHNLLYPNPNLDDTIRRLLAFEKAGADVLFAPGLPDIDAVRAVCSAVSKPVNFMVGIKGKSFPVDELVAAGVKRISLATSLYRAAMTGFLDAVYEIRDKGHFSFVDRSVMT